MSFSGSYTLLFLWFTILALAVDGRSKTQESPLRIRLAVLSFGDARTGKLAAERIAAQLKLDDSLNLIDADQTRVAAKGAGYSGSLNLSLNEARDLGAALGAEFFVLGDAQTLRRSPSTGPIYFESYASIFVVSARTGRLIIWERPSVRGASQEEAERSLLAKLSAAELRQRILAAIRNARDAERNRRQLAVDGQTPIIEAAPDDEKIAEKDGLRLPRPYRRLVPAYPSSAADAEVEAMVDVLVDIDSQGEVMRVEVARWAGFGLDESTMMTVKQLHFFPAMRNGTPVPLRVLLRYNFRKPPRTE